MVPVVVADALLGRDAVGGGTRAHRQPAAPDARMLPVGGAPVRATLALEPVAWGTRLDLTCTYEPRADEYELPAVVTYVLVVRTRDGRTEQVGTWRSIGGRTMRLTAATSARRSRDRLSGGAHDERQTGAAADGVSRRAASRASRTAPPTIATTSLAAAVQTGQPTQCSCTPNSPTVADDDEGAERGDAEAERQQRRAPSAATAPAAPR